MGFRFQKRIRIFKGLTVNLSKSSPSFTIGGKGASINIRSDKVTGNAGIPGTGISYRHRLDDLAAGQGGTGSGGAGRVIGVLLLIGFLSVVFWLAI